MHPAASTATRTIARARRRSVVDVALEPLMLFEPTILLLEATALLAPLLPLLALVIGVPLTGLLQLLALPLLLPQQLLPRLRLLRLKPRPLPRLMPIHRPIIDPPPPIVRIVIGPAPISPPTRRTPAQKDQEQNHGTEAEPLTHPPSLPENPAAGNTAASRRAGTEGQRERRAGLPTAAHMSGRERAG